MFKKIDRFVIKSYIGPLLITFFIVVFVLLMQFLWRYIDDLVGKGLAWSIIAELLLYASANLVPLALPLAVLLASIMIFGNMGEHNELMAIKAAGVPLQRVMRPLLFFNFFIAIGAFLFSNNVLPYTNLKYGALLYDVKQQRPEINIKKGIFYDGVAGMSIKISDKNQETNMMYGMMIYDHRDHAGNLNVVTADSASMIMSENKQYLIFTLYGGEKYEDVRDRKDYKKARQNLPFRRQTFTEQKMIMELSGYDFNRSDTELFRHNYQMLNLRQLKESEDSLETVFQERKLKFYKRMFQNNYFIKMKHSDNEKAKNPNLDSIYKGFDYLHKYQSYEKAMAYARAARSAYENNVKDFKNREEWINKHSIAWHKKFTLSVACLILFFIGAPLGAIIRKGGFGVPVIVSVLFFLLYYIISMVGERSIKAGNLLPIQGMWMASAILLPFGAFLTYKATHDSVILSVDTYVRVIKLLFPFKSSRNYMKRFGISSGIDQYHDDYEVEALRKLMTDVSVLNKKLDKINRDQLYFNGLKGILPYKKEFSELKEEYNKVYGYICYKNKDDKRFLNDILVQLPVFTKSNFLITFRIIVFSYLLFPFFSFLPLMWEVAIIKRKITKIYFVNKKVLDHIKFNKIDSTF